MKFQSSRKDQLGIFLLFSLTAVLYFSILLTSQSYVDGDEAVVGVMARHIITQGNRPIFFYGQPFGGGGAIEAYLAVIPFSLFGQNSISLKLVALLIFLATLLLTYRYCRKYLGRRPAIITFLILAFATSLIEWHTKMRGGYSLLLLLSILLLAVYTGITRMKRSRIGPFILLGFLSGFAIYNHTLILSLLFSLFIVSFSWKKLFWRVKSVGSFLAGITLGLSPLIYYNITHNFLNLKYTVYIGSGGEQPWLQKLELLFSRYLPGFFVGRNVDGVVSKIPPEAWVEYAAYLLVIGCAIYFYRHSLRSILLCWLPSKFKRRNYPAPKPEGILVFYLLLYLFLHTFSRAMTFSPRYLLPLFPALAIVVGAVIARMLAERTRVLNILGMILLLTIAGLGFLNHLRYLKVPIVTDDIPISEDEIINVQTSGKAARNIIEYLEEKGVNHVHCSYFLQWRLIFESRESVIASSGEFALDPPRYPPYDREVYQAEQFAIIFHRDSIQHQRFISSIYSRGMFPRQIDEYIVYLPRSLL